MNKQWTDKGQWHQKLFFEIDDLLFLAEQLLLHTGNRKSVVFFPSNVYKCEVFLACFNVYNRFTQKEQKFTYLHYYLRNKLYYST